MAEQNIHIKINCETRQLTKKINKLIRIAEKTTALLEKQKEIIDQIDTMNVEVVVKDNTDNWFMLMWKKIW